ncbi:uncharacterized protein N7515_001157 [Penicillium bovifimosum]|uniref:Zn(2)-C6 fungal-type domain-containing protein n=1 Tax=Penicillium bovifimosum TaxID=126998 RepID=A0A9W9HH92_9EURO|nr:uncharacterized protein N7515_001157 [Penicillium bovifimosum]KAJ5146593.1 hypothetical protein N7515_001157 [Penicillium bovifimosum]
MPNLLRNTALVMDRLCNNSSRPIAPRGVPRGHVRGAAGRQPPEYPGGAPPDDSRMKRASTACRGCQKRRTRCTGVPCSECIRRNRECIFDELADRRRKASARRMQEELIGLQEFLVQLLGVLREGNNAEVQYLVNAIRSGTSTQDIDLAIRRLLAYNPSLRFTRQMNS